MATNALMHITKAGIFLQIQNWSYSELDRKSGNEIHCCVNGLFSPTLHFGCLLFSRQFADLDRRLGGRLQSSIHATVFAASVGETSKLFGPK